MDVNEVIKLQINLLPKEKSFDHLRSKYLEVLKIPKRKILIDKFKKLKGLDEGTIVVYFLIEKNAAFEFIIVKKGDRLFFSFYHKPLKEGVFHPVQAVKYKEKRIITNTLFHMEFKLTKGSQLKDAILWHCDFEKIYLYFWRRVKIQKRKILQIYA